MARLARVELFAADEVAVVHVMNRVVRRCFLLGESRGGCGCCVKRLRCGPIARMEKLGNFGKAVTEPCV